MTAWTNIPSTDTDADSPGDIDLAQELVDNDKHLREFITGSTERYNDRIPHDHSGNGGDLVVEGVSGPNLVLNPCPAATNDEKWLTNSGAADSTTQTVPLGGNSADYLAHRLTQDPFDSPARTNEGMWGAGSPLVISFFAKATASLSAGSLYFGIADGTFTAFTTGHRFTLDYTDLSSTTWKRFWVKADKTSNSPPTGTLYPGDSHASDVTLLFDSAVPFVGGEALLTGFSVCQSDGVLTPFNWAPNEHSNEAIGRVHGENRQPKAPIWSTAVSMTNAVEITTRA